MPGDTPRMLTKTHHVPGRRATSGRLLLAGPALLAVLLTACGPAETTSDGSGAGAVRAPAASTAEGDRLGALLGAATFSPSATDVPAAVEAFRAAGADFSPQGLKTAIPQDCTGLDVARLGRVIGVPVSVEKVSYGLLAAAPGYLSCALLAADDPDVALAYVHLAPNLTGAGNWAAIGTLDGATPIPGLGDRAEWSDGSGGSNATNATMLQVHVQQGGTESLIQAQANEPQTAIVGSWSVPQLILALAVADGSLTS